MFRIYDHWNLYWNRYPRIFFGSGGESDAHDHHLHGAILTASLSAATAEAHAQGDAHEGWEGGGEGGAAL